MSILGIALQVAVLTLVGAAIMWARKADKKRQDNKTTDKNTLVDKIIWIAIAFMFVLALLGFFY